MARFCIKPQPPGMRRRVKLTVFHSLMTVHHGLAPNATRFALCKNFFHPGRGHRYLRISMNRSVDNERLLVFHNYHNEAVPETTPSAARNCFAAEFISVGTGFCTNRNKARNVVQKRCSTEMNSVVDEHIDLVKLCLLCLSKNV